MLGNEDHRLLLLGSRRSLAAVDSFIELLTLASDRVRCWSKQDFLQCFQWNPSLSLADRCSRPTASLDFARVLGRRASHRRRLVIQDQMIQVNLDFHHAIHRVTFRFNRENSLTLLLRYDCCYYFNLRFRYCCCCCCYKNWLSISLDWVLQSMLLISNSMCWRKPFSAGQKT